MTDSTALDALAARDRFEVAVAVLVVATTLVAACVGLLFANASNQGDEAAADAQRAALRASAVGVEADQHVDEALTRFGNEREHGVHARSAYEAELFGGRPGAAAEARRWERLAPGGERSVRETVAVGIADGSPQGPKRDGDFPGDFRDKVHQPVHLELAHRAAANGLSAEWGQRTASYAAILTLLAVALYLFGFALTPQGRRLRGLFAAVATSFLFLGLIFGPVRALSSPGRPAEKAATEFALGAVAYDSAATPSDFATAEEHLTKAIRARPDFVEAYELRSSARFLRGTPQFVDSASLTTPSALQRALEDLRMARSLGLRTSTTLGSEGFYLFLLSVRTQRPELLPEALALTRAAVDAQPRNVIARFNLGVTLLAADRAGEARREYRRALGEVVRLPESRMNGLASGALTDLELVALHGPIELADEVRELKELIAGSIARRRVSEPRAKAPAIDVDAVVRASHAEVRLFTLERDPARVSVHWYHEEPQGLGWSHLPQLMVRTAPYEYTVGTGSYVASTGRCLPGGRYRAEVYVGGRLVGSATTRYDGRGAGPAADRDHDLYACRPVGWDEQPDSSRLVRTYRSDDRRSGLHLVRLDRTLDLANGREIERALRKVVRLPRGPLSPRGTPFVDAPLFYEKHVYAYPGGRMHVAVTGLGRDGTVLAAVFGPARDLASSSLTPDEILSSLMAF